MGIAYKPEIDGLRAIAVLAVVLFHAGLGGAGFVGVDVFFVISGYLITSLLLREGRIDLMAFYARRVRRIFPAAAVVVLATLAASYVMLPFAARVQAFQSAGAALMFCANLFFQFNTGGYWDASAETMPLLHLWSLSVEEQFYLLWPALLLFVPRHRLRGVIAGLLVVSLATYPLLPAQAAFYAMPARFWELAAGGLIATLPARSLPAWTLPAGIVLTLAACIVPLGHFPGAAVLGASVIIAAVHGGASNRLLASKPMVGVGLVSYSLYLWHWPLLALYRAQVIGEGSLAVKLALCVVAALLAVASYRFVEQPFRRLRFGSGRTVAVGIAVPLALALGAWSMAPPTPAAPAFVLKCQPYVAGQRVDMQRPQCFGRERKLVLWGDSMAHAWTPLAEGLATRLGLPAVAFSRDGCPAFLGEPLTLRTPDQTRDCAVRNQQAVAYLRRNGADVLVIATHWQIYTQRPDELLAAVEAVSPSVGRIYVIAPTPQVLDDAPKCARLGQSCAISQAAYRAESAKAWAVMRRMQRNPKVQIIDPAAWLCDANECPGVRDGVALYRDAFHVDHAVAQQFAGVWLHQLKLSN